MTPTDQPGSHTGENTNSTGNSLSFRDEDTRTLLSYKATHTAKETGYRQTAWKVKGKGPFLLVWGESGRLGAWGEIGRCPALYAELDQITGP